MKHPFTQQIIGDAALQTVLDAVAPGRAKRVLAEGAWGSTGHLLAGAIAVKSKRPVLLVVAHLDDADEAVDDLELFDDLKVASFPALEVMPGESNVSLELLADRLALMAQLFRGEQPDVIVAPIQALMQAVPKGDALNAMAFEVRKGQTLDQAKLVEWLTDAGYRRGDAVEEIGDFAVRGGIVDVVPPGNLPPIRIDFFGDEVDAINEINLDTMGSGTKLPSVRLIGASAEKIQNEQRTTAFWSLLKPETIAVLHETMEISEQARGYYERLVNAQGIYPPKDVQKAIESFAAVEVNQFAAPGMAETRVPLPVRSLINFDTDAAKAVEELAEMASGSPAIEPHDVVVLCRRDAECSRLRELIKEHAPKALDQIRIEIGYLYRGFVWAPGSGKPLALVPHHELMHRYQTRRRIRRVGTGRAIDTFLDIEVGDYVVHSHHGIALFRGMRMMKGCMGDGAGEEYLTLEFADKALLHVPASQIDLVHKYVGGFSGRPPLSKLGGTRWKKQKDAAAEAAKNLAAQMLRVMAARASLPGFRYPEDSQWMKQFEAEFPYQETDDQLAAIAEIKKDMTSPRPMDRLICGDVGYGKTEVAIRAAFKAVDAGKQVAVLCPTTVLCEQHERTFHERMADYPVKIAGLNRFKTPQQIKQTLQWLQEGSIDVVIGTHRLLSEDVIFADLGLVVVDEEQRFGVEHKQKLMRFRVTVDMLTLSATPIPRTLHMALLGLRDISSLSTPPADRRAVVTEVVPFDLGRIKHGILRELNRGGQVFFVHNRVNNIYEVAAEIQSLVPDARIVVGHGQMHGHELEDVMMKFVKHEADVLVSTTIIESGIDIPTANTMFITDADHFGLAELHQLRGRVGRYKHRAYCYLLLPKTRPLTEVAQKRLRAIEEFSMLGAGFKIAMRDMEIRGVGNILGPEQSGHIATIGYELYCRLLEQATQDLKREKKHEPTETHLEIKIAGHLPRKYVPSDKHRMEIYRRIGRASDLDVLRAVEKDLVEAYGPVPKPAQMLLALAEIRIALSHREVDALKLDGQDLIFTTRHPQLLSPLLENAPGSVRLVDQPTSEKPGTVYFRPPPNFLEDPHTLLAVLRKLLVRTMETTVGGGPPQVAG
jgi:transcription-repair coupling factor (superfamily II helicase)